MRRRRREESPVWLITYSDLMTLLLVFFVFLLSFSTVNEDKFRQFIASYQGLGILPGGMAPITSQDPAPLDSASGDTAAQQAALEHARQLMAAYQRVQDFLVDNELSSLVQVRYQEAGIALDIKERILFDSGQADLKAEARGLLQTLSGLLRDIPNEVRVEGHTDNRPIHTVRFPTNWELSTARAARVVRYFTEELGLPPERFVAIGYGEHRPLFPNDTPAHMAANRRVVLLIGIEQDHYNPEVEHIVAE
ncbi:MAG TPA: OmpA family protein [Firmicutes bacterium]|nr:OmpA family protein [Bacillota bacterium]